MNVVIGGRGIQIAVNDPVLESVLRAQYAGFIEPDGHDSIRLRVDVGPPLGVDPEADIQVRRERGRWLIDRGDFHASYDPSARAAIIDRTTGPYGIDSVIRIIHSLVLAEEQGILLHAASVIRGDRAFVFAGPSGVGKTTISRLARGDDHLLTDEISYLRRSSGTWTAFGTPFAGELARPGQNRQAPVAAIFLLHHGEENRLTALARAAATRAILRNVLFFADDPRLTMRLFETVCTLVESVSVSDLSFLPDSRIWSLIR